MAEGIYTFILKICLMISIVITVSNFDTQANNVYTSVYNEIDTAVFVANVKIGSCFSILNLGEPKSYKVPTGGLSTIKLISLK